GSVPASMPARNLDSSSSWPSLGTTCVFVENRAGRREPDSRIRDLTKPGQSTETPTGAPTSARSIASDSATATSAALLVLYAALYPPATKPAMDAVKATWLSTPRRHCSSIQGTNAPTAWIAPHRLTPRLHSQSPAEWSQVSAL